MSVITEDDECEMLKENLKEAHTKIKGLEQTVELLQENNKVIDSLRKELEEERERVRTVSVQDTTTDGRMEELM